MKKIISLISAIVMFAAISGAAMAADNSPAVYVNYREIFFEDQKAEIVDERTLVPARGVFETMGATVNWDSEKRLVEIESGNTVIRLTIDDKNMKVYDTSGFFAAMVSGQDFQAPETVVELDVPPQIMNDRTMIPLRAISEALDADVEWNGEAYCVDITTKDKAEVSESAPKLSLLTSTDTVAEGETVDVYVTASNIPDDLYVSGVISTIFYNKENFEFVEAKMMDGENTFDAMLESNPNFNDNYVKVASVTIDPEKGAKKEGKVMQLTFKSKNGKEGAFFLSDSIHTKLGYNTNLYIADTKGEADKTYAGDELNIDTTPVVVNAEAAE